MNNTTRNAIKSAQKNRNFALGLIIGLLVIRLITLRLSPYGLHGDEAQYWAWAQDLDWGYFSKPPMIAWIIAATTVIFGDAWACAVYSLMPAVWVSSMIISTDVALLFFWALALHAWVSVRHSPSWRWVIQLGIAIGLGMMSKYAMMFFIPPLIIALIFDTPTRKALLSIKGGIAAILAGCIVAPNIIWNISHNYATFTHTAANTNLEGKSAFFHPSEFLKFFGDQFGVFGPIPFILLLITFFTLRAFIAQSKNASERTDDHSSSTFLYLIIFALTPLLIISIQAFLSRANANWAVSAYPSASLLLGAGAAQIIDKKLWRRTWLKRGLIAQTVFCMLLLGIAQFPNLVDKIGAANSVKRLRAWPQTIEAIETRFAEGHEGLPFEAIVFDHRLMFYDANYYGMAKTAPIFIWQRNSAPKNHAELTQAFTHQTEAPILLINYSGNAVPSLTRDFANFQELSPIEIDLGGGKTRTIKTWAAYGYKSPIQK